MLLLESLLFFFQLIVFSLELFLVLFEVLVDVLEALEVIF